MASIRDTKKARVKARPKARPAARTTESLRPGPGGLPRTQVAEIQRSRMLAATVEVVEEVGYGRLTVAQVISRAKVSRKTFYDLFEDREDCFVAVFDQSIERAAEIVRKAYERERGWREAVRAALVALLRFFDEEPALARLVIVEALGAGPKVLARRAEVLERVKRVVELGGREAGPGRPRRGQPADIMAEGVVGAAFTVVHSRLIERDHAPLVGLAGPLMSIIVLPYLGTGVAAEEMKRPGPRSRRRKGPSKADPLGGLHMRLTYRTMRVLSFVGDHPGASNREVAEGAGIADQGQMSKLLGRLERLDLIGNTGAGQRHGAANEWRLTERGRSVERAARPL